MCNIIYKSNDIDGVQLLAGLNIGLQFSTDAVRHTARILLRMNIELF